MHLSYRTFTDIPRLLWHLFFGQMVVDVTDLELFKRSALIEVREKRVLNFLRLQNPSPEAKPPSPLCQVCRSACRGGILYELVITSSLSTLQGNSGTVLFFVHGSMASMQQYEYQIQHFMQV